MSYLTDKLQKHAVGHEDHGNPGAAYANMEAAHRIEVLESALNSIIEMNVRYAVDKFGDAEKAESMSCVRTARAALANTFVNP